MISDNESSSNGLCFAMSAADGRESVIQKCVNLMFVSSFDGRNFRQDSLGKTPWVT